MIRITIEIDDNRNVSINGENISRPGVKKNFKTLIGKLVNPFKKEAEPTVPVPKSEKENEASIKADEKTIPSNLVKPVVAPLNKSPLKKRKLAREKICPTCGESYEPTSNAQMFCSEKCKVRPLKSGHKEKICSTCGKQFIPSGNRQKYCSEACGMKPHYKPLGNKGLITTKPRTCPKCGKDFIPSGNRQKYCSEACGMKPRFYQKKKNEAKQPENLLIEKPIPDEELISRAGEIIEVKSITDEQIQKSHDSPYPSSRL